MSHGVAAGGGAERLGELRQLLLRYRADRHPVEHATAQFHLGVALIEDRRSPQATDPLRTAAALFESHGRAAERAKALNMLGVALREDGRLEEAADTFARAEALFASEELDLELGAARYNLGLTHRALGDREAALEWFTLAWEQLAEGPPGQAAAVARERAATLLEAGRAEDAAAGFDSALELASRSGDRAAMGAAANGLGLALLGAGHAPDAVDALRIAIASHPRRVRPADHAMAQANLALAYADADDAPRARLAARQALSIDEAAPPVEEQATAVLARLGDPPGDLFVVLDEAPRERWLDEARPEISRWADLDHERKRVHVDEWIEGQLARRGESVELAATYLGVLLELPPDVMEDLVRTTVAVADRRDAEERTRLRDDMSSAMVRFNVPQWLRLKDTFQRLAAELDAEVDWG